MFVPQCSHIIAIDTARSDAGRPEMEEVEAVACAVQNLALSAHTYGLGAAGKRGPAQAKTHWVAA